MCENIEIITIKKLKNYVLEKSWKNRVIWNNSRKKIECCWVWIKLDPQCVSSFVVINKWEKLNVMCENIEIITINKLKKLCIREIMKK
jgi:hypothetical protein